MTDLQKRTVKHFRKARTSALTKAVKQLIALHGGFAFRNNIQPRIDPKTHRAYYPDKSAVGSPDLIAIMPRGLTLWIEIKISPDKVRPSQQAFAAELDKRGHCYVVVHDTIEYLENLLQAYGKRFNLIG
jgi:hypothetical protein